TTKWAGLFFFSRREKPCRSPTNRNSTTAATACHPGSSAMVILRTPDQAARITDENIRRLVELRFAQICAGEPHDPERHGYMVVIEPGDRLDAIEAECPLLFSTFGEARLGDPDFTPAAEVIEEQDTCFELSFILN